MEQLESNLAALAVEVDSESLQRFEALREDPTARRAAVELSGARSRATITSPMDRRVTHECS